ncbi:MAG: biopolymer transporter ExbD [Elusimicrobia bacterium]|nr:biopolymer transporter ExbD [Elusimicrobiota bacterium]
MIPFNRPAEPAEISEVNVVPLADVSLVLLIILLVLSPMMAQHRLLIQTAAERSDAAPVEAPAPPPALQRPPDMVLVVGLAPDGVSVGDRVFTGKGELIAYLAGLLLLRSDRKVFLAPQAEVQHGRVVELLETLKEAGASSVALVQSAPPEPAPGPGETAP